jgi:methylenetetrahydrofolate dehydrogenase (NADP+) / methenyltetrahydrofolate cyclohydrolase
MRAFFMDNLVAVNYFLKMILKSKDIREEVFQKLQFKRNKIDSQLYLDIVLSTNDPVSKKYVTKKQEYGQLLGIEVRVHQTYDNVDVSNSNGIIIQLPATAAEALNISKIPLALDVDLMNNFNELISLGIYPPTIKAILQFIESQSKVNKESKVTIIGEGVLVGAPLKKALLSLGYEVKTCNEFTNNTKEITSQSDVIVSATGVALLVDSSYISRTKKQLWIDAGTAESNGKIVGDINLDISLNDNITLVPCPGGVGPLTVHNIFENLISMYNLNLK